MSGVCRRTVLVSAAAILAAGRARAENAPRSLTLVVAGPRGGQMDRAAAALLSGLQAQLPPGTVIARTPMGGIDGVTAANRFNASADTDGGSALLIPPATPIAWLVGDSRVHFDPGEWVPVLAGVGPAMVVANRPVVPGGTLRVATSDPSAPALAALLGLDLLGAHVHPVGPMDEVLALAALHAGSIDAALITSGQLLGALAQSGGPARVLFRCGAGGDGPVPDLAHYAAAVGRALPEGPHLQAWRAAASAARLRYALVLQEFSSPSAVALWRTAGSHALLNNLDPAATVLEGPDAGRLLEDLAPGSAALLDLRGWLTTQIGWQPG